MSFRTIGSSSYDHKRVRLAAMPLSHPLDPNKAKKLGRRSSMQSQMSIDNECVAAQWPIGVGGLITPRNHPVEQFTWKASAAVAAGCTCVVKSLLEPR